ncbi:hypothetical protein E2C01_102872 [Portunus trituberculatus]|uniref:Uncharacterized protein n=1 Tax=Portunus trituberculatus TaxID=210409 RepID=A0A5B7KDP4_PORTR|nr:hypothetical protein [Portunus trituberculatus]
MRCKIVVTVHTLEPTHSKRQRRNSHLETNKGQPTNSLAANTPHHTPTSSQAWPPTHPTTHPTRSLEE